MSAATHHRTRSREQSLAWLKRQKRASLSPWQRSALTSVSPGWDRTYDDLWFDTLAMVEAFWVEHGRLPTSSSNDAAESAAGQWLAHQRFVKHLAPAREQALRERLPEALMTRDELWMAKLRRVAMFLEMNGHLPRSSAADANERVLGRWLANVKWSEQPAERILALDAELPQWRQTAEEFWNSRLDAVADFVALNGRFPKKGAEGGEERTLASWLHYQKTAVASGIAQRRATLTDRIPGWDRTRHDAFNDRVEEAVEFVARHGRFPVRGTGRPVAESNLARFLYLQGRNKNLKQAREAALDNRLPGWRQGSSGTVSER